MLCIKLFFVYKNNIVCCYHLSQSQNNVNHNLRHVVCSCNVVVDHKLGIVM